MKASQWVDQARAVNGWESDYRAAKELGISRAAISVYRNKPTATFADDIAIKVAHALGREPVYLVLDQVAERSTSEEARMLLQDLLASVRRAAAKKTRDKARAKRSHR